MQEQDIKAQFKRKAIRFYWVNFFMAVIVGLSLYYAGQWDIYREAFIPIVVVFFLWIFNVDKVYSCPACGQSPRGKEGLIYLPSQCNACGVKLR